jgi:signal transduction histidine kinase
MVPLKASKVFSDLPAADVEDVARVAREISFGTDQTIFKEGDPGDGIYIVKEGLISISAIVATGESRVLTKVGPGELFGEMAVLDHNPRSAGAMAAEPSVVYFIERKELMCLFDRTPRLAAALVRDISRRLRDFNRQYVREVLESERLALVGRFASSIVHDLKNPLNIIGISADMACMPTSTPESRQVSKVRIRKQVDRISNMVNELLEFAQGANTNIVLARVEFNRFIQQLIDEIQPEVSLKSVTIEYVNQPPAVAVKASPQRLARVFHNLIGNATDAMPSGGKIQLRFETVDQKVVTEIEDSGKGIAPEIADRLFQAFATYGKANGTGLGLTICKKIVQDHHGAIYAKNSPNGGAIFGFSLPILASS